tara:strand:+ start:966 stop:1331 length:366 start_codon:yes stop_codon:yes gene_type:complete
MQAFRVIALSLGGLRNKVFGLGDVVNQAQLAAPVNDLVAANYLEPIEPVKTEVVKTAKVETKKPVLVEKVEKEKATVITVELPSFSELSKKQIIARLKSAGAKFDKTWTKTALYGLLEDVS